MIFAMDRYEIKFNVVFSDGEEKTIWNQMMCIPREDEILDDFYVGSKEHETVDLRINEVSYCRVGKYDDGSHGIKVEAHVI
jgi:hypothetical protein